MNRFERLLRGEPLDRALVMGILNVTPDSFSDGGRWTTEEAIKRQAEAMTRDGADMIDIGGESTRPGAEPVPLEVELERVMPAIEWVRQVSDLPLSIDTSKPEVMEAALQAGVALVNDVNALQAEGAVEVVARHHAPVCLMHRQGDPRTMQDNPQYRDVVAEVATFLHQRAEAVMAATGLEANAVWLDPGFGFGKTLGHNRALFQELDKLVALGHPLLVGVSRKRMIGELLGRDNPLERVTGSVAAATLAALKGASVVRVHDVRPTVESLNITMTLL
ncbi:dihydropteroate synthase [Sulfurivirga sp.]|uniref:dihydropteroate synthase n=1 Tax=Sulfurivirga sp. TaxID=2614236 RepID=UPI0025F2F2E9|nr:dihydropteroate synthase [Sulfurivirga sp.]